MFVTHGLMIEEKTRKVSLEIENINEGQKNLRKELISTSQRYVYSMVESIDNLYYLKSNTLDTNAFCINNRIFISKKKILNYR